MTTETVTRSSHSNSGDEKRRLLLDVPSSIPALGFPRRAQALAEIVMDSDPRFAIGIFGGWGSGKTTLMRAIETLLREEHRESAIRVWFNAWRYEKEEHLIVPLLDTVREALLKWSDQAPRNNQALARETARAVGRVMTSILAGTSLRVGIPGAVDLSFDANKALEASRGSRRVPEERVSRSPYHASFRALSDAFDSFAGEKTGRRIVVFVDDLDRCLPERALDVLESMKLFFDLEGFIFVVGLDREIVQEVVETKYRRREGADSAFGAERLTGEEYVKKIFQLPFPLAAVPLADLSDFLRAAYEEAKLSDAQRLDLKTVVEPHLRHLVDGGGFNPREVKRYVNAYTLQTKVNPTLDCKALLAVQTITFRSDWDIVENALLAYGTLFTGACREYTSGNANALIDLDPDLFSIPDGFLEYVQSGQPGHALLEPTLDLEGYIASGESSGSTRDTMLLSAIRALGEARRQLRVAIQNRSFGRTELEQIGKQMASVDSAVELKASLLARLIRDDCIQFQDRSRVLGNRLTPEVNVGWDDLTADVNGLDEIARRAAKRLLRLYRFAEAPTDSGATGESFASSVATA